MKSTWTSVISFTMGAAVGALVAWKVLEKKYDKLIDEEIESVKESFSRMYKDGNTEPEEEPTVIDGDEITTGKIDPEQLSIREYKQIIKESKYTNYSGMGEEDNVVSEKPYVIAPDDFDELYGYEAISLTYYADGVLTDAMSNELVEDVDNVVGADFADHIGDYEESAVHIRNDRLKADYEILCDLRNYSDVINPSPHSTEDE